MTPASKSPPIGSSEPITLDNWRTKALGCVCPRCHAGAESWIEIYNPNNNSWALSCACGQKHPLPRVTYLKHSDKKTRSASHETTQETWARTGGYCYGCGVDESVLRALGIGQQQHHTRPYADHEHASVLIPLCTWCHGLISAHQSNLRRFIMREMGAK